MVQQTVSLNDCNDVVVTNYSNARVCVNGLKGVNINVSGFTVNVKNQYELTVELPTAIKCYLDILNDVLLVRSEHTSSTGNVTCHIAVPEDADTEDVRACMQNGVLVVAIARFQASSERDDDAESHASSSDHVVVRRKKLRTRSYALLQFLLLCTMIAWIVHFCKRHFLFYGV